MNMRNIYFIWLRMSKIHLHGGMTTISFTLTYLGWPSTPATSTAVEQVFSQGRILLNFMQNWLTPATIHTNLCLRDWCCKGLMEMADLLAAVREKKRKEVESDVEEI